MSTLWPPRVRASVLPRLWKPAVLYCVLLLAFTGWASSCLVS